MFSKRKATGRPSQSAKHAPTSSSLQAFLDREQALLQAKKTGKAGHRTWIDKNGILARGVSKRPLLTNFLIPPKREADLSQTVAPECVLISSDEEEAPGQVQPSGLHAANSGYRDGSPAPACASFGPFASNQALRDALHRIVSCKHLDVALPSLLAYIRSIFQPPSRSPAAIFGLEAWRIAAAAVAEFADVDASWRGPVSRALREAFLARYPGCSHPLLPIEPRPPAGT